MDALTYIDWFVLGVMALSTLVGLRRGLMRELIALLTWVAAIGCSVAFTPRLIEVVGPLVPNPELQSLVSWSAIFTAVFMVGSVVKWGVSRFVAATPLRIPNHLMGGVFGFVRGILLLSVVVLLVHFSLVPKQDWWAKSVTIPYVEAVTHHYYRFLPDNVKQVLEQYSHIAPAVSAIPLLQPKGQGGIPH